MAKNSRLRQMLGMEGLNPDFLKVLQIYLCYLVFTNLHTMFINTLFIKLTGDSGVTMFYNTVVSILGPFFTVATVACMRRFSAKFTFTVAIADFLVMYVTFFTVMNRLDNFVVLIAFLAAMGQSFFFITYANAVSQFSSEGNTDQTVSFMAFARGIVSLAMPFLSGFLISRFEGLTGYYVVFGLSAAVAAVAMYKVVRMPRITFNSQKTQYKKMAQIAVRSPLWRMFVASELIKGFRSGVFNFFLNILLFRIIQSELLVGVNNVLVGISAILASWVCGRLMKRENRVKLLHISVSVLVATTASLYWLMDVTTILLFSAVNSFFGCWLDNGYTSMFYLSVKKTPGGQGLSGEFITLSQFCMGFGGAAGMAVISMLPQTTVATITGLLVLGASQYISNFLMKTMQRQMDKTDAQRGGERVDTIAG